MLETPRPLNDHNNNIVSWIILLVVACLCFWYFSSTDGSHISERINTTTADIQEAERLAQSARIELAKSESLAREAEERITASTEYNTRLTESIDDDKRIIDELRKLADSGESIIDAVIQRSKARTSEAGVGAH